MHVITESTIHDQLSYLYHHSASAYVGMMTYDYYLNNVNMVYSPGWISEEIIWNAASHYTN